MSFEGWGDQRYQQHNGAEGWNGQNQYAYDSGINDFGQEQSFQSFDYSSAPSSDPNKQYIQQPLYNANAPIPPQSQFFVPGPSIMTPNTETDFETHGEIGEDEPPLLEELGIDPDAIIQKTLNVLNPLRHTDPGILKDTDLAGPLVFGLAFGSFLLLAGKVHFGYIYGIGLFGCIGLYALLNLMSLEGVGLGVVVSVLGYCLLPMVGLAGVNVVFSLQGAVGTILTSIAIFWCSWSASKLFVTALSMHHQQPLVAYPCGLFYAVFALLTIF